MAENKKSFILYCDQKGVWDKLNNEQAGKLIKHIIAYVNDENPQTDDFITELAFEPIKQHLKRDLKKWENQYTQRVEAGKKSAEVRKRNATTVDEPLVSSTDNVNVNGSVNVNDTVTDKKVLSTTVDYSFEISILEIIRSLKSEYKSQPVREYKITAKRKRQIFSRRKEFDKLWPGRDFKKACEFAFRYKAKEWFGTDMFKYFEPETLLSEKFVGYVEKAEQDGGEPYRADPKQKEEKVSYRITPNSYQNG